MLRVMKQKAQDHDEKLSSLNMEKLRQTPKVVVSHVPVSVGSQTHTHSANSSISSKAEESDDAQKSKQEASSVSKSPGALPSPSEADTEDSLSESVDGSQRVPSQNKDTAAMIATVTPTYPKKIHRVSVDFENSPSTKKLRLDEIPTARESRPIAPAPSPIILLASDRDAFILNPMHALVRSQIEVFTATPTELAQPAPGRKQPIKLNQVGLRCIHCRHVPSRKRVKRAVCYPSSVGRLYHSVSDMKFDHFSNCKELPEDIRVRFESLKAGGKKNSDKKTRGKGYSSSTAQFYHDAALQMGMVAGPGGIFMINSPTQALAAPLYPHASSLIPRQELAMTAMIRNYPTIHGLPTRHDLSMANTLTSPIVQTIPFNSFIKPIVPPPRSDGQVRTRLGESSDAEFLNPLHCFVRQHVEVFTADKNDISAPAPGRKTRVLLGQVGIRCIHCAKLCTKDRVKRAVCYPPSVNGIYHSVSNMKFDHFGICRGLHPKAREDLFALKSKCSRRGPTANYTSRGSTSSTAQYYHDSAMRKGLIDTEAGIRFNTQKAEEKPALLTPASKLPTGMNALMMAASQASEITFQLKQLCDSACIATV